MAIASEVALTSSIRVQQQLNVVGDADRLYRLVANLIVNAIQYTPAGGTVTVILDCSHQEAIVQVQDTGIGMAVQIRANIRSILPSQQRSIPQYRRFGAGIGDRPNHSPGTSGQLQRQQRIGARRYFPAAVAF